MGLLQVQPGWGGGRGQLQVQPGWGAGRAHSGGGGRLEEVEGPAGLEGEGGYEPGDRRVGTSGLPQPCGH